MSADNERERSAPQAQEARSMPLDEATKASILAALATCANCLTGMEMGVDDVPETGQELGRELARLWQVLDSATEQLRSASEARSLRKPSCSLGGSDEKADEQRIAQGVVEAVNPTKAKWEADVTGSRPSRILIAEDSDDSRFLLQEFLKGAQFKLTFTENGKAAVETARGQGFDLILMDIQMPVMDGLTATKLIREAEVQAGLAPIPILALTGNTRKADIELSLAAGCNAHILKPVSKPGLLESIHRHLPEASTPAKQRSVDVNINQSQLRIELANQY